MGHAIKHKEKRKTKKWLRTKNQPLTLSKSTLFLVQISGSSKEKDISPRRLVVGLLPLFDVTSASSALIIDKGTIANVC